MLTGKKLENRTGSLAQNSQGTGMHRLREKDFLQK